MNKELKEYTNKELLNELLERAEHQTIITFADLLVMFGELSIENPTLYQQVTKEMQKRMTKS